MTSNNSIDFALQTVDTAPTLCTVTIQNIGGYVAPADVILNFADGTSETHHQTPAIWQANQRLAVVKIPVKKKVASVRLEGGIFMDADERNNVWKSNTGHPARP